MLGVGRLRPRRALPETISPPAEGETHDPFTEGQVYFHLHEFAEWANVNFGLHLAEPIRVFTNFPLTNAFFGDFDDDGVRTLKLASRMTGTTSAMTSM